MTIQESIAEIHGSLSNIERDILALVNVLGSQLKDEQAKTAAWRDVAKSMMIFIKPNHIDSVEFLDFIDSRSYLQLHWREALRVAIALDEATPSGGP